MATEHHDGLRDVLVPAPDHGAMRDRLHAAQSRASELSADLADARRRERATAGDAEDALRQIDGLLTEPNLTPLGAACVRAVRDRLRAISARHQGEHQ